MGEEAEFRLSVSYTTVKLIITATLLLTPSKPFFYMITVGASPPGTEIACSLRATERRGAEKI